MERAMKRPRLSLPRCDFHVVFLVDASGSMSNNDVESANGKITRIDAVFDALACFGEALLGLDGVACSIAIFNESHYFAMRNQPVGIQFKQQLSQVHAAVKPKGGGYYLDALRAFQEASSPSGITVGVLLSDGVPSEDMRDSDCAGRPNRDRVLDFMRTLRRQLGPKCVLHTVGFGDFNPDCLQTLACDGGGSFYDNRKLQASALRNTFRRLFGKVSTLRGTVMAFGEKALKPLPPRQMEPVDAWEKASAEELSGMSKRLATWVMLPREKGCADSELVPQGSHRNACLHKMPFAEGSLRYAFHFFILNTDNDERNIHLVVKEGKFASASASPQESARSFLKNHDKAQEIASAFRDACKAYDAGTIAAKFVPAYVVKTADSSAEENVRYSTAEKFIPGEFVKMNGNDGYVNKSVDKVFAQAAAAFSHFSFHHTNGAMMCVDVQGVGLNWTDPQLHSLDKSFGPADLGKEGMKLFFSTHVCSRFCSQLKLPAVDAESLASRGPPVEVNSSSSSSSSSSDGSDAEAEFLRIAQEDAAKATRQKKEKKAKVPRTEVQKTKVPKIEKALTTATYEAKLYEYLKKHGRTKLGKLGQEVPKSQFPGATKLSHTLIAHPAKFVIVGDTVDIKR